MSNNKLSEDNNEQNKMLISCLIEVLRDLGVKITAQRKLILEAVASQVGWHVHPKDVYDYVQKRDSSIGIATVYRTLKLLEDMDLIEKAYMIGMGVDTKNSKTESAEDAHYMVCLRCGDMQKIDKSCISSIDSKVLSLHGFSVSHIKMTLYGLCKTCNKLVWNKKID